MWKNTVQLGSHRSQYGACALYNGQLRLQTHTQDMQYLLLFYQKSGCMNVPKY